jgi:hypothetical protein
LFRVCPGDVMPAVDADQFDRVDHRVPLESFQRIDQNRLVIHIDELFGNVEYAIIPQKANSAPQKSAWT